jgi:large subunit ribosomal protein L25
VKRGEKVTVEVYVHTEGELAPGSFLLEHVLSTLTVEAEATHIPESVTVSIAGLEAGASIAAKDIPLPRAPRWSSTRTPSSSRSWPPRRRRPTEDAAGRGRRGLIRTGSPCAGRCSQGAGPGGGGWRVSKETWT